MDVLYLPFGKAACGDTQYRPFPPASITGMLGQEEDTSSLHTEVTVRQSPHAEWRGQACSALMQNWGTLKFIVFKNDAVCRQNTKQTNAHNYSVEGPPGQR